MPVPLPLPLPDLISGLTLSISSGKGTGTGRGKGASKLSPALKSLKSPHLTLTIITAPLGSFLTHGKVILLTLSPPCPKEDG
jgi:hypothetical protein